MQPTHPPASLDALLQQGRDHHGAGRLAEAEALYRQVLALSPDNIEALHLLGVLANQAGQPALALQFIDRALQINSTFAEVHVSRGNALYLLRQHQRAIESYDRALEINPGHTDAWNNRGSALQQLNDHAAAVESYDRALRLNPQFTEAWANRGGALHLLKQYPSAVESYDRALRLNPNRAELWSNRGSTLQTIGQHQAALESCDRALGANPRLAAAHNNRGSALHSLLQYEAALAAFDEAIRIQPDLAEAHAGRGNTLYALGHHQASVEAYDRALQLNPSLAEAHNNRGGALHALLQYDAALEAYDRALQLNPDYADAHSNRANVLHALKQYQPALDSYHHLLRLRPDYEFLPGMLLHARRMLCDWQNAEADLRQVEAAVERGSLAALPFTLLAVSDSPALQRLAAEVYAQAKLPRPALPPIPRRAHKDKIRVGYFSADFYNHATSFLMAELFELHDRSRFEILGFSFGPPLRDEMATRVSAAMDRYFDVLQTPDLDIAQLSRDLEVDIAVDLKGFTRQHRAGIFAHRAAPIQVSFLGYPGTMGTRFLDYLIADPTLIPASSHPHYSEKVLSLPHTYQPNDSHGAIATTSVTREAEGLPPDAFVFCCFNSSYKITPTVFSLWMKVLARVDASVLWLIEENPVTIANLRREAESRGISPDRLVFARPMSHPDHLARHALADLFLDTSPYNAHTTASDALYAGLPLLTRIGNTFAGRVAASLLRAAGLPELVTQTDSEYEDLAVALALDPARLQALRRRLQENRGTAPLFDTPTFTRHFESAYTAIYDRYQAGHEPTHVQIHP